MNTSGQSDKMKGTAKKTIGAVEGAIGKATHNERMEHAGQKKETEGRIQKGVGNVKSAFGEVADKVKKATR